MTTGLPLELGSGLSLAGGARFPNVLFFNNKITKNLKKRSKEQNSAPGSDTGAAKTRDLNNSIFDTLSTVGIGVQVPEDDQRELSACLSPVQSPSGQSCAPAG